MSRTKYYINSFPILFFIQEVVDKCVAAEIESVFDIMELEDAERNKLLSFNQVNWRNTIINNHQTFE